MRLPNCWRPEWAARVRRRDGEAVAAFEEVIEHGDCKITMRLIFQAPDDGRRYAIHYQQGATELQEDADPWNWQDAVEAEEVQRVPVVRVEWQPVAFDAATFRPHPAAQGIADQAAHRLWRASPTWLRGVAARLGLLDAAILAPDTERPATLVDYLDRIEGATRETGESAERGGS